MIAMQVPKKLVLVRLEYRSDRILGKLLVFAGIKSLQDFTTLELPLINNERNISAIPPGRYEIEPRHSDKHGDHFIINGVPDRDLILIHTGNFPNETRGCILLGMRSGDIDNDGIPDLISSKAAMGLLTQWLNEKTTLVVIDA